MSNPVYEKLLKCVASVREKTDFVPKVALVLGSGLGNYGDTLKVETIVDYKDIEDFPVSTAPGHKGRFIFGYVDDVPVVCMQGRVHSYEGYEMTDVVLPIRLMKMLGAKVLFVTNASGAVKTGFKAGQLMLITGQNTCFVPSPLIGANIDELGPRFPDMSQIYNLELQKLAKKCAMELDIDLKEGVYFQLRGPQYETPQEINMVRTLGGDAVGMSTGVEAIAANHMGMKIIGISCLSNLAAGISPNPLSEQEVLDAGAAVGPQFTALVTEIIKNLK